MPPDKIADNERFQGVFGHRRLFMRTFGAGSKGSHSKIIMKIIMAAKF
jgi:hypothetical protein